MNGYTFPKSNSAVFIFASPLNVAHFLKGRSKGFIIQGRKQEVSSLILQIRAGNRIIKDFPKFSI